MGGRSIECRIRRWGTWRTGKRGVSGRRGIEGGWGAGFTGKGGVARRGAGKVHLIGVG